MSQRRIGTREQHDQARQKLLEEEKELTRRGDELARRRRELPWVPIEKAYRFNSDHGEKTLVELFDRRSQLLVYHFMFGPSYQAGCPTCSSIADSVNGILQHLRARDATLVFVSHAPIEKLRAYRKRMGWNIPWVSCAGSDFNFDFGYSRSAKQTREAIGPMLDSGTPPIVEQMTRVTGTDAVSFLSQVPGFSAFAREDGAVYHTYSTTARGLEFLMGYYNILDRAPKGRDEQGSAQLWIRRHDEYQQPVEPAVA